MSELLKGNFTVKRKVASENQPGADEASQTLSGKLRKVALASIGGSMVYMERTDLTWNGDDK